MIHHPGELRPGSRSVIPRLAALVVGARVVGWLGARTFGTDSGNLPEETYCGTRSRVGDPSKSAGNGPKRPIALVNPGLPCRFRGGQGATADWRRLTAAAYQFGPGCYQGEDRVRSTQP